MKKGKRSRRAVNQLLASSSHLGRTNLATTPGNPNLTLVLPEVIGISAVVGTGTLATSTNLNAGLLTNFATRFQAFDEYRILKLKFYVYSLSTSQGYASVYVDPLSNAAPTSTTMQTNVAKWVPLNQGSAPKPYVFTYNVSDSALLAYQPIATTTFNVGFLKAYADTTNTGNNLATGNLLLIRADVTVEFRGLS